MLVRVVLVSATNSYLLVVVGHPLLLHSAVVRCNSLYGNCFGLNEMIPSHLILTGSEGTSSIHKGKLLMLLLHPGEGRTIQMDNGGTM